MKKIFLILSIAALAAGCAKDGADVPAQKTGKGRELTLVGGSQATRTAIGAKDGSDYPVVWVEGDALGLYSKTAGTFIENDRAALKAGTGGSQTGTFTADAVDLVTSGKTDLIIYYPYNSDGLDLGATDNKVSLKLSKEQVQKAPGNSEHVVPFAYAKASVTDAELPVGFELEHPLAYVKFVVSSTEFAAYKLQSIQLFDKENDTPLAGDYTVDMDAGTFTDGIETYNNVRVTVETPQVLSAAQELYLATFPADMTGDEIYVVVTLENDQKHTVTIPVLKDAKEFKAGALNVIELTGLSASDNGVEWFEPIETRVLVGGWAYGPTNCVMVEGTDSAAGTEVTLSVKARGNFAEVAEPKTVKVTYPGDLHSGLVRVNGKGRDEVSNVASDYTITINARKGSQAGNYAGGFGQVTIYGEDTDLFGQPIPIWSFIVWITPTPAEHTYGTTGYVVQDRNLGAPMTTETDWKSNGAYMQWGRPVPFGWSAGKAEENTNFLASVTAATDVRYSIVHSRELLSTGSLTNTGSDWFLGAWTGKVSDRKDFWGNPNGGDSWANPSDGNKSVYDPCPKGYRVVSPKVLKMIADNAELMEVKNAQDAVTRRYFRYKYDGTNYAFWPFAGARWGSNAGTDRTANNNFEGAYYWSNSGGGMLDAVTDNHNRGVCYVYRASKTPAEISYQNGRSHAFSIRCMKDTDNR